MGWGGLGRESVGRWAGETGSCALCSRAVGCAAEWTHGRERSVQMPGVGRQARWDCQAGASRCHGWTDRMYAQDANHWTGPRTRFVLFRCNPTPTSTSPFNHHTRRGRAPLPPDTILMQCPHHELTISISTLDDPPALCSARLGGWCGRVPFPNYARGFPES